MYLKLTKIKMIINLWKLLGYIWSNFKSDLNVRALISRDGLSNDQLCILIEDRELIKEIDEHLIWDEIFCMPWQDTITIGLSDSNSNSLVKKLKERNENI